MSNCSCERWLQCITCSMPRCSFKLMKNRNQPLNCQRRTQYSATVMLSIVFISIFHWFNWFCSRHNTASISSNVPETVSNNIFTYVYLFLPTATYVYRYHREPLASDCIINYTDIYKHQVDHMQLLPKYQIFAIIVSPIQLIPSITFVLSVTTLSYIHGTMPHVIIILSFVRLRRSPSPSHRTLCII